MANFKPVGVDENSNFPARVQTKLDTSYAPASGSNNYAAALINGKAPVRKGDVVFNVKDYGALGNYTADDTSAINSAITAAAAVGGTVVFPRGTYTCDNIIVPDFVKLLGEGGGITRFTAGSTYLEGTRRGGVALRRITGSTNPLLTQSGSGSWVENFELQGNSGTAPILVHTGFQTTLKTVTCIGGAGIGIDVQKANNSRWYDIEVQNCGSSTLPGVKIWSKSGTGLANETNTLDIYGLTIERCTNVHLDIAYDPAMTTTNSEYWAEFIRITNLHVESSNQNSGSGSGVGNIDAAVRLGGIRSIHLTNPFIYAGPGPCLLHDQQLTRSYLNGGVKLVNGTVIGSDTSTGVAASTNLVRLINGTDFSMESVRWARCTGSAVLADSTYGADVTFGMDNNPAVTFTDNRSSQTNNKINGNIVIDGHITTTQAALPTLNNATGTTGHSLLGGATDVSGKVFLGTTATPPVAGGQLSQINFRKSYGSEKPVTITPGNPATAALQLSGAVSSDGTNLKVYAANAPAASLGNTALQYNYRVG